jgi:hypothetical protein
MPQTHDAEVRSWNGADQLRCFVSEIVNPNLHNFDSILCRDASGLSDGPSGQSPELTCQLKNNFD